MTACGLLAAQAPLGLPWPWWPMSVAAVTMEPSLTMAHPEDCVGASELDTMPHSPPHPDCT